MRLRWFAGRWMKSPWWPERFAVPAALREQIRQGWMRWLVRRIPRAQQVRLTQKNIFIFPSMAGWVFLLFLAVMLLTAINYRNNMVFLLTFMMAGMFVMAIHHTFFHLSGLVLVAGQAKPVFAGQMAAFELVLERSSARTYPLLELAFDGGEPQLASVFSPVTRLRLHVLMPQRGYQSPPRIRVENRYPLGLLRAWTWVDLDMHVVVYPRPLTAPSPQSDGGQQREGKAREQAGMDDFHQLRDYQAGDSLRHVAWKNYAKGQPLQTRQYHSIQDEQLWLDWQQFAGMADESRLSRLCFQVLEAHRQGLRYGMRLPGEALPPASGDAQREQALRMLALYGQDAGGASS